MDVEELAVSEVKRLIAMCPHLKSYIDTNDKTPLTDGHIELYGGLPQSNSTRRGRVPVQVKGRSYKNLAKARQNWRISRTDLLGFQQDSGVFYFFVRVEKDSGNCTVYYSILAPFKIEALLNELAPGEDSIAIELKRVPGDPAEVESLLFVALLSRDQNPAAGFDPALLEVAESLTLHAVGDYNFDAPLTIDLASGEVVLVLHTSGGMSVALPGVLELVPGDYTKRTLPVTVTSGATTYQSVQRQRIDEETVEISLGDGVKLTVREEADARAIGASYSLGGSLAARLRAIDFMQAFRDTGTIEVDGKPIALGEVVSDERAGSLDEAEVGLRQMAELCDVLGADKELLDLDTIGEHDISQFWVLYKAFVRGEEVVGTMPNPGFVTRRLGDWRLIVFALATDTPDRWKLVDPFSADFRRQFWARPENEDSKPYPVTPYDCGFETELLSRTLNLHLDSIVGAYETVIDWPDTTFVQANLRVLSLIAAADSCGRRWDELLDAATELNEWLISCQGAEPHHLLNRWQILHRRGEMTSDERLEVRALKHRMSGVDAHEMAHLFKIACAILLDESEEVDYLVAALSEDDLTRMQSWPIWAIRSS